MPSKKNFLGIGAVYAAGQILLQSLSLLLLPLYTRYLSVGQYGQFSITASLSELSAILLVLGIYSGYNRFYKDYDEAGRLRLRNTAFTFSVIIGPLVALVIIAASGLVNRITAPVENLVPIMILIATNNLFFQISVLFICDYYLEYRANQIVIINLVKSACSVLLIAYFLVARRGGIVGIYTGQMIASFLQLAYFLIINRRKLKLELDRGMLREMLKFGVGLIPCNLSAAALNFSDRLFIAGFRSFGETGFYSVGYKIGMQIDPLFCTPFRQIFTTYKYERWKDENAEHLFNNMYRHYHVLGCLFVLGLAVFSRILIYIFTDAQYLVAYPIVPLVLLAYFLFGETNFFNLGIEMKNKTYLDSAILISGGVLNVILNFTLIPGLGMTGAAISTVLSYILVLLLYAKTSGRLYRVKYDFRKPLLVLAITVGLYGVYYLYSLFVHTVLFDLIPGVLLPAAYVLICVKSGVVTREEVLGLIGSLFESIKRKKGEVSI